MYPSVVSKPAILSKWKNNGVRLTGIDVLQSWTKNCRQIHEIKQNRFFYGRFYSWFYATFYRRTSKFGFWEDGWVLAIKSKHSRNFLEQLVIQQLVRQLLHSPCGDNNLVPFHLWWSQIALESEKVWKCFVQDCLKIFLIVFICLEMLWNPKNDQFLVEKKSLFINTALLLLEQRLVPNSYLTLKFKIVFFERYHIQIFFATELP